MTKPISRRRFVEITSASIPALYATGSENPSLPGFGSAKNCIYLFMDGGMSHLDTFDPKPSRKEMGPTSAIETNVPGEFLSENLPNLAEQRDKFALVRSLTQKTGNHDGGSYMMRTSHNPRLDLRHPSLGPWAQHLLGKRQTGLPDSVAIMPGSKQPGCGFLPAATTPFPVANPKKSIPFASVFGGGDDEPAEKYRRRRNLMDELDSAFREKCIDPQVQRYTDLYEQAFDFMDESDTSVFNLSLEPDDVREHYGNTEFGQGCLLAKKLISAGVRFVDITHTGWDTHSDNFHATRKQALEMDLAVSNLLTDLDAEGLLADTLVVIATEFGRTPIVNSRNGRDHHPRCFSCVLAGAGIKGGSTIGETDPSGSYPVSRSVSPADFNATIAHSLGMNLQTVAKSRSGRPFTVAGEGQVIPEVFV